MQAPIATCIYSYMTITSSYIVIRLYSYIIRARRNTRGTIKADLGMVTTAQSSRAPPRMGRWSAVSVPLAEPARRWVGARSSSCGLRDRARGFETLRGQPLLFSFQREALDERLLAIHAPVRVRLLQNPAKVRGRSRPSAQRRLWSASSIPICIHANNRLLL